MDEIIRCPAFIAFPVPFDYNMDIKGHICKMSIASISPHVGR